MKKRFSMKTKLGLPLDKYHMAMIIKWMIAALNFKDVVSVLVSEESLTGVVIVEV